SGAFMRRSALLDFAPPSALLDFAPRSALLDFMRRSALVQRSDSARSALCATLIVSAVACGSDPSGTEWPNAQVWRSAHFVYHARPDDTSVGAEVLDAL